MRAFADLLETVSAAGAGDSVRNLTTTTAVKTALKITDSNSDTLIDALVPRVSRMVETECRLARSAAGELPTFARETLRATWYITTKARGSDLYLPWRPPFSSLTSVVEDGDTLAVGTDHVVMGNGRSTFLRRMSDDSPIDWSMAKIVVTWVAGYASTMSSNIEDDLEAAAIEQIRAMLFGASRDPALRSVSMPDVASESYSVPGGDTMGGRALLPNVRDMLAAWRNPTP